MLDFQRKKDNSLLDSTPQRESSCLYLDQSKNIYDFIIKHDNQMKQMELEIINLKSQLNEITTKIPLFSENNNQIKIIKDEIKDDIIKDLNDVIISQKDEFKQQIESLKEEIEIMEENRNTNKLLEINNSLENLNQQLLMNNEEKNNLENIIFNKVDKNKKEINMITSNINKRIDNFDLDFDRLIQSLKVQFLNSANTINQLELSKVNINEYEKQIDTINLSLEELNNKIDNINEKNNILASGNNDNEELIEKKLNSFKNELYNDLEKINLKILRELKNQADDIKVLYQEHHNSKTNRGNIINNKTIKRNKNLESLDQNEFSTENIDNNTTSSIMSMIEIELSKKANLDQLNFALETQAKLNEAFSSATRICRFCWDSDGILNEGKYIQWSMQNINTALDVFKWENNSDSIIILQNGVYKITIGLIGLEIKRNFGLIFNNDENIMIDSRIDNHNLKSENINDNDIYNERGNVKFVEKYIACIENIKIKVIIFDDNYKESDDLNDNSEEAFLEIIKII